SIGGGNDKDLIFGHNVSLDRTTHLCNFTDPRFEALNGTQIYSSDLTPAVGSADALVNGAPQLEPRGSPRWGDYLITLLYMSFTPPAGTFAHDYIAGGGGDNMIFGEMGGATIQGAGSIDYVSHLENADDTLNLFTPGGRVGVINTAPIPIISATWSNNTATITTAVPHGLTIPPGLKVGESVEVTGVSAAGYNGIFVVTGVPSNTFSYKLATNPDPGFGGSAVNEAGNPFRDAGNDLELYPSSTLAIDAANHINDGDNYIEGGGGPNIIFGGGGQ